MSPSNRKTTLKPSTSDYKYALVKGLITNIPILGAPAAELLSLAIESPLSRRRDMWLQSIAEKITHLESVYDEFKTEKLSNNEQFITIFLHATQIALRNHQEEKLEALRNAVLNSAISTLLDDDLQIVFLNHVDRFTNWHIKVLEFFKEPRNMNPLSYLAELHPELAKKEDFYIQIFRDLTFQGMISARPMMDGEPPVERATRDDSFYVKPTSICQQFLDFITTPSSTKNGQVAGSPQGKTEKDQNS